MWTTQKHVPRWDLPAGLAGAHLGVKTPLPIPEGASRHIIRKHAEKLAKYGDLRVEVSRMWQCRTQVVPVVLGALGTVHADIARWLDIIPGHHNLQHLQKAVLLGSFVKSCLPLFKAMIWSKYPRGRVCFRYLR